MNIPTVGWAFFGLTVVLLIGYLLTIGIYVGTVISPFQYANETRYSRQCNYLYLSGTRQKFAGIVGKTRAAVEDSNESYFCQPFGYSN